MKMTVASSLLSPFACSLVTCCGLLLCVLCSAIHPSSRQLPWIRLTSDNFSSEIHTYPFVLCLATVPWSGESRSLMTDLSETLGVNENLHISTQLRVVYINQDKCLDKFFLQSKRYLAFTFFWYSTPFRYKGKLRAQNILTAINHAVSLKSSDYPFKRLETKSDLDRFRESTDRAVILFDFCNYSDRIKDRHHSKKDKSIQLFARSRKAKDVEGVKRLVGLEEELLYEGSPCLTSNVECAIVSPGKQDFEVDAKSGTMDSRMCHRPLLEDLIKNVIRPEGDSISYSPQNNGDEQTISCESEPEFGLGYSQSLLFQTSSSGWEISQKISSPKNVKSVIFGQLDSCNNTEYTHFVSIHRNLVKFVKTYILTPEQVDFAIVENKSLLPALGIDVMQNHTWFLMQWIPDWPDLPLLYDEHEELHSFLFHPKKLVNELVLESIRNPSSLLNDTSSVVLFIDRVSPVMDVRKKSWEALKALRAFARGYFNQENLELHLNAYPEVKGEPYLANKGLSSFVHSIFESRVPKEDVNSQESTSYAYTVSHLTDKSTRISENGPTDFGHNVVMKILVEGQKNLQLDASLLKEDLQSLDIDGEDQWKEVIEPSLPYPSIVILDFLQEEKFVFSAPNRSIDYTSLKGFFERYADNQLQKTYLSEVAPNKPRKRVQPPFVNRDFHETDGVPRITTERLLRLLGYSVGRHRDVSSFDSTEDMGQLCKKSALVLYTAPACGFCKRMELVFREVHRMITLYLDGSGDSSFMQEVEHTYSTFDMGDKDMNIGGNLPVFAS
ncbi:hypothetical protein KP509_04G098300 [Ceratopteris richardii]|uniref:Uncharacterized protein n=1 Tax=Ceratopteris richardii TaxID=49495 RepID=A0A8T2V2U1_CERRI|nr:hypothetical protein KP509_04G098300 [Ceratopteris richardii]